MEKEIVSHTEEADVEVVGSQEVVEDNEEVVDWVIGSVPKAELKLIEETAARAAEACACYITNGPDQAMNRYN